MTPAEALRRARRVVSLPTGSRNSWTIYAPYRSANPDGPRTDVRADSYAKLAKMRPAIVACCSLGYLGRHSLNAAETIDHAAYRGESDPRLLLAIGLEAERLAQEGAP